MLDRPQSFNRRYFSALLETIKKRDIQLRSPRSAYIEHRQIIDSWPIGMDTAAKILKSKKQISVDLTLKSDRADEQFVLLRRNERFFEGIIGVGLHWKACKKERQIIAALYADPTDECDWRRQHAWLAAKIAAFRIAFEPSIQEFTSGGGNWTTYFRPAGY